MKKYFLLIIAMLLFPIITFAADVTEIGNTDFNDAANNPGEFTIKGIKYTGSCYDLSEGKYKLTENINLGTNYLCLNGTGFNSKSVSIDLNGNTIDASNANEAIRSDGVSLLIRGDGEVLGGSFSVANRNGNLEILGGTYNKQVNLKDVYHEGATLHIEDGTFNSIVDMDGGSLAVIDGGTFNNRISLGVGTEVVINGGEFYAPEDDWNGISASYVTICGGTFTGLFGLQISEAREVNIISGRYTGTIAGLVIMNEDSDAPKIQIKHGTFTTTGGEASYGSIILASHADYDDDYINTIISEGFGIKDDFAIETMEMNGLNNYMVKGDVNIVHYYKVLEGDGQIYTKKSGDSLVFRFNTPFEEFQESGRIYIDDTLVGVAKYSATEGSTIITIFSEYLDTLDATDHTLTLVTDYDEVTTTFSVVENEEEKEIPDEKEEDKTNPTDDKSSEDRLNPKTGDNIMAYTLLTIISGVGLIGLRKCKRD